MEINEYTYETRRVVVTDGLGVTVGLQYRVGLYNGILQRSLLLLNIQNTTVRNSTVLYRGTL